MIRGQIIKNRPLVALTVGWKSSVQDIVATIDTGFTGGLKLSEETVRELGLDITHMEAVQLGDGSSKMMPAALALVNMEGVSNVIDVLVAPGDNAMGVGLLKKFQQKMEMDFKFNSISLQKSK